MASALESAIEIRAVAGGTAVAVTLEPRARLLVYLSVLAALLLSSLDQTVVATATAS